MIQSDLVSGAAVPALPPSGSNTDNGPFVPALPAQPGRVATRAPLTPNATYRLTETLPPVGYRREGVEGGVWRWIISTEPLVHTVTFHAAGGQLPPLSGITMCECCSVAYGMIPVPHGATIGAANVPFPSRSEHAFGGWFYIDQAGNPVFPAIPSPINNPVAFTDFFDNDFTVTRDVTFIAEWLGIGRSGNDNDINPPPITIVPTSGASIDTRITSITPLYHDLYFFDMENEVRGTPPTAYTTRDWHVGNRRPRLNFTKHDRDNDPDYPLNGAIFVVERRVRDDIADPWDDDNWTVIYTTQPSGSIAIPLLPAQPGPINTPEDGMVVITRPIFSANVNSVNATGLVQYRLRETYAPSGYLIPIGYWLINTNRYSGVTDMLPAPITVDGVLLGSMVPYFEYEDPTTPTPRPTVTSPVHPRPWDVYWSVYNTPTRYWPFLKTDGQIFSGLPHRYLHDAEFRLFVYTGTGAPTGADNMVAPNYISNASPSPSDTWRQVATVHSNGPHPHREPMWLPMMPGRHYQLVEVLAPVGYQLPWGQWRFTVDVADAVQVPNLTERMRGSGLTHEIIGLGTPQIMSFIPAGGVSCDFNHLQSDYDCNCNDECFIAMYVHHIANLPDFDLPLTGGTGTPTTLAIAGTVFVALGIAVVFVYFGKSKSKAKA